MEIRPAQIEDIPVLAGVTVASWQAAYRGIMPSSYLDSLKEEDRALAWRKNIESAKSLNGVATKDGTIAGYANLKIEDRDCFEVPSIYVHPERWREKVGEALMDWVFDQTKLLGSRHLSLWVASDNLRAIEFYRALGYSDTGEERANKRFGDFQFQEKRFAKVL